MDETLVHIGYVSKAVDAATEEQLKSILTVAHKNNSAFNITGMLVYSERSFFQVIEGPQHNIKKLLTIIENDPRHKNILVLFDEEITQRNFSNWSMSFHHVDIDEAKNIPGMNYFLQERESLSDYLTNDGESAEMLKTVFNYFLRKD